MPNVLTHTFGKWIWIPCTVYCTCTICILAIKNHTIKTIEINCRTDRCWLNFNVTIWKWIRLATINYCDVIIERMKKKRFHSFDFQSLSFYLKKIYFFYELLQSGSSPDHSRFDWHVRFCGPWSLKLLLHWYLTIEP